MGTLKYVAEAGGYLVLAGGEFIGRVYRSRSSYDHSNGRTYRSWSWSAVPSNNGAARHQLRTRPEAGRYLLAARNAANARSAVSPLSLVGG